MKVWYIDPTMQNEVKTLEIGQEIHVDGFGLCRVQKLGWHGVFSKHYLVTTQFGDRIEICWNAMLEVWVQHCKH
jgi:hypothetical protein